ncbi:MAG: SAM-dependent methyltransferase [Myxococcota bacterium]
MAIAMTQNYSAETDGARLCLERSLDLVDEVLAQLHQASGPFCFADFGAADGGTTEALYKRVTDRVKESGRPLLAILNDLPGNDFDTLSEVGRRTFQAAGGQLRTMPRSFYETVAEPASVDLGFTATAMHWLSSVPEALPHHTHANAASPSPVAFRAAAVRDWDHLLALRANELVPGGSFVAVNLACDDAGRYLGNNRVDHNMHDVLHDTWLGLHREGAFDATTYRAATFQNFYKREEDFRAPFEALDSKTRQAGLRLMRMRTVLTRCPYRKQFDADGDADVFATALMKTVRSWSKHTFETALDGHPERDVVVSEFYRRFQERVRHEPRRFSMDYVHNHLLARRED